MIKSLDANARASATSIAFRQLNLESAPAQRPEVIAVLAQAASAKTITEDVPILSDGTPEQAFALFGASPMFYAAQALFPVNGNGAKCPVYMVPVEDGSVAATIVVAGFSDSTLASSFSLKFGAALPAVAWAANAAGKIATNALLDPARAPRGKKLGNPEVRYTSAISLTSGLTLATAYPIMAAAINADPYFPCTALVEESGVNDITLTLTAKWAGVYSELANLYYVKDGADPVSVTTGTANPLGSTTVAAGVDATDLTEALANLPPELGITRVVNQFDDDDNLDLIQAWGEGHRDSLVSQYAISYFGREYDESGTVAGTIDVAAIASFGDGRRLDAVNSAVYFNYGNLRPLTYTQRDTLVKAGVTNIEMRNGVHVLTDVVTFYHPEGVLNPIYRFDEDVTKIGNLAYDLRAFFGQEEWESKILVSRDSRTTNSNAIDIDDYVAARNSRAELWEKTALIASAEFVKANSVAAIDALNPGRINDNIKAQLSSTLRIVDNTLFLGYLFGETA